MISHQGFKLNTDSTQKIWDNHYTKPKSFLNYPDENLVRILTKLKWDIPNPQALDLGAGSGRHSQLLKNFGYHTIAIDYSPESIAMIQKNIAEVETHICSNSNYPIPSQSIELVVAWGMLHYNSQDEIDSILNEVERILKKGGVFVGTLRSDRDTHLKKQIENKIELDDLKGGFVQLFNLEDCKNVLKRFKNLQFSLLERTPLGDLDKRISHYVFYCENP
jgi:SAM-dependent methyltransferase